MLDDHAKVLKFFSQTGEVVGRKKLQKIIYIAKKMDIPFSERYKFHMFGPYSEELSLRMEELSNLGFVHEIMEDKGHYQQYRYSLSEQGESFLALNRLEWPDCQPLFTSLNEQSSRFLELVSTLLYFADLSVEEVKEKVFTLKRKQNYSEADIEAGFEYIEQLKKTMLN
ncbi:YwgA family protein [Alkalihalobacillus sp. 1P02AB]|uniref:YwgA family protein n=1 Tax=Alkalihalobacillus sp. 1P02AB TaxID=3132260 RepID=UPI0039A76E9F